MSAAVEMRSRAGSAPWVELRRRATAPSAAVPELRWVALGDSLTAPADGLEETWTELVARTLRRRGTAVRLENIARHGFTAGEVARAQLPRAIAAAPDLVTLICGGNDVILTARPNIACFRRSYEGMLRSLARFAPQTTVLTATYPPIAEGLPLRERSRRRVEAGLDAVNDGIRLASRRFGAELVELADHPGRFDGSNYAADGFHPSAAGHREAAAVMLARLDRVLATSPADAIEESER